VIDLKGLIGRRILHVTTSWHHHPDAEPSLLHLWLHIEDLGPVRFHTATSGALELQADQPHDPYDMDQYGHVAVEDAPADSLLNSLLGQPIHGIAEIHDATAGTPIVVPIGVVLLLPEGDVRILNLADELVVTADQVSGTSETRLRVHSEPEGPPPQSRPSAREFPVKRPQIP